MLIASFVVGWLFVVARSHGRESRELLEGSRIHLGCLGVVSKLTLDIVPYYGAQLFKHGWPSRAGLPFRPLTLPTEL